MLEAKFRSERDCLLKVNQQQVILVYFLTFMLILKVENMVKEENE